ncbi:hypothetical protein [Kitasatospora sp. NPDC088346]|uniref:hypothetical protein n=1 Tax=Kitasatospora sp. NPDC088346 TaxID=3364073 RepID=UPI003803E72D
MDIQDPGVDVDPISAALLIGLATGVGGEAGRDALALLGALVRRPFRRSEDPRAAAVGSGEAEVAALEAAPDGAAARSAAQSLRTALAERAAVDPDFRTALQEWHRHAEAVQAGGGGVHNAISGGTFQAPVVQGRNISGFTFGLPPAAPETDQPG